MGRTQVAVSLKGLLHSIFTSFYLYVFLKQHVPEIGSITTSPFSENSRRALLYFASTQLLCLVWGVLNDLFLLKKWRAKLLSNVLVGAQLRQLSCCGPIWALLFALLWVPVGGFFMHPGLQFTVMMIMYEKLLECCEAALHRLLERKPPTHGDDIIVVPDVLGGVGVGLACYFSEVNLHPLDVSSGGSKLRAFRWFSSACALVAGIGFYVCDRRESTRQEQHGQPQGGRDNCMEGDALGNAQEYIRFAQQTMARYSMKAAVLIWAMQGYSCVFATWFFNLFLVFCDSAVSSSVRTLLLLLVHIAPNAVAVVIFPIIRKFGSRRVVGFLLLLRAAVGVVFVFVAVQCSISVPHENIEEPSMLLALLLLWNRLLTDTFSCIQELILSDLTHEDIVIFSRLYPMTNAIRHLLEAFSKPFQILALVVTCLMLAQNKEANVGGLKAVAWISGTTVLSTSFLMLWGWQRYYNLDGLHLQFVRMAVRKRADAHQGVV